MQIAVCSICSRVKDENKELLPARKRYLGSHVLKVEKIALEQKHPFFILSGVYGFISGEEKIPTYDHLLAEDEVSALAEKIQAQIEKSGASEIHFYTKNKPNWKPYRVALEQAAQSVNVELSVHELAEND